MPAIKYITTDSNDNLFTAETFLNTLRLSNPIWWNPGDITSNWVFRGHADSKWELKPSAWREKADGNALYPLIEELEKLPLKKVISGRMQQKGINDIDDTHPIYSWINAELEALFQFSELGNHLGFNVEPIELSPRKIRFRLTGGLLFEAADHANTDIAQHHGIPTRYLDFTTDPILAVYHAASFSVSSSSSLKDIAVWAVNKNAQSYFKLPGASDNYQAIQFIHSAAHRNPYLQAQSGLFVKIPFGELFFYHKHRWPDLEELLRHSNCNKPILIKYILNAIHLSELRDILQKEGFSKAKLMPTLDNVADTIKQNWIR
jgi:hypothetical protein